MIKFKHFLNQTLPVAPRVVHGSHATKKTAVQIPALPQMMHGKHSIVQEKIPALPRMMQGKHSVKEESGDVTLERYYSTPQNQHMHGFTDTEDYENHVDEMHKILSNHQDYSSGLDLPEKMSVRAYTRKSSLLNTTLIDNYNYNTPVDMERRYNDISIPILDSATKKFTLPKMTLFHGTGFNPTRIGNPTYDGNHVLHIPSFLSTSYDHKNSIISFSRPDFEDKKEPDLYKHLFQIEVPEGHPGLHIGQRSNHPTEGEVLLPRNTTLKFFGPPTTYESYIPGTTRLKVWKAHPVPPGEDYDTWQPPK